MQLALWEPATLTTPPSPTPHGKQQKKAKSSHVPAWKPLCLPFLPPCELYCEPYGAWTSLSLFRTPAPIETFNDYDESLVSLFRRFQKEEEKEKLRERFYAMLYSQSELDYFETLSLTPNPLHTPEEHILHLLYTFLEDFLNPQSLGQRVSGELAYQNRWLPYIIFFDVLFWRFASSHIDQRDPLQILTYWDTPNTSFFLTPPGPLTTWHSRLPQPSPQNHQKLLEILQTIKGYVTLLTHNPTDYEPLLSKGWAAKPLPACPSRFVLINPACSAKLANQ